MTWRDNAACRGLDPEIWFPWVDGASLVHSDHEEWARRSALARSICATCPVQSECLAWAIENKPFYGIWAGRSAQRAWS